MSQMSNYLEVELRTAMFRTTTVLIRGNSTSYAVGARVMLGTADTNVYECISITTGTSAGSVPTFNTTIGSTTTDGGVTWMALQQGMPKRPMWISLHVGSPTDTGTGGVEVSGGSYARVPAHPLDAMWSAPDTVSGTTANATDITFPPPTANWGAGPINFFGVWDRLTGGNMIAWGAVNPPKTVNMSDPAPKFPTGALIFTLD